MELLTALRALLSLPVLVCSPVVGNRHVTAVRSPDADCAGQ